MACSTDLVPLSSVVKAAIVDSYEDGGKVSAQYYHWAARAFKYLNRRMLKTAERRKVILPISPATRTATLPSDFKRERFVGYIHNGEKIAIPLNIKLVDDSNITEAANTNKCDKCNQDKNICNDFTVTQEVVSVEIEGQPYDKTTVKKLQSNGDYCLETTTPVYNTVTEEVDFITEKEFITNIDLLDCGCPNPSASNLATISEHCPDVYSCYYTECSSTCNPREGGYKIFEDSGLIQLDNSYRYDTLYLEYDGFLPKKDGQLLIPEVAFEAVVAETKVYSIKNKKNEPYWRIREYKDDARQARNAMVRELGRVSLNYILEAAMKVPNFDYKIKYPATSKGTVVTQTQSVSTPTVIEKPCEVTPTQVSVNNLIENEWL